MAIRLKLILITLFCNVMLLSGCTTGVVAPAKGTPTVKQAYYGAMQDNDHVVNHDPDTGGIAVDEKNRVKLSAKSKIVMPSLKGALQSPQVLKAQADVDRGFPLLPNPQVVLYLCPHFEGQMPVHGNWTTFPLFAVNHYALPSEVQT